MSDCEAVAAVGLQVQASKDAANDWKLRYEGLQSDMLQAQQQLAGVRGVSRQRDELVIKVREQKEELGRLQVTS